MPWIVVQTKSKCEQKANLNLERQGFVTYFPKLLKKVKRKNLLTETSKPLFPGYIFVNLKKNQNWVKINYTYGVVKVLQFNQKICLLPIEFIKNLKKKCLGDNFDIFELRYKKGDLLNYWKNEKYFFNCIFEESIDEKRSYVLLDFIVNKIKAKVENKFLQSAF